MNTFENLLAPAKQQLNHYRIADVEKFARESYKEFTTMPISELSHVVEKLEELKGLTQTRKAKYRHQANKEIMGPNAKKAARIMSVVELTKWLRASQRLAMARLIIESRLATGEPIPLDDVASTAQRPYPDPKKILHSRHWTSRKKWCPYGQFIVNWFFELRAADVNISREAAADQIQILLSNEFEDLDSSTFTGNALKRVLVQHEATGIF